MSSLIRALGKLPGVWGDVCYALLADMFPGCGIWVGNQCSHGLTSRPLESSHPQCLKAVCGVFGRYPAGAAAEL